MSTEDEFQRWLRRKEKSFEENLEFALKAWQSMEFALPSKYEVILEWISNEISENKKSIPFNQIKEILKQRAPSGLIKTEVKRTFVNTILDEVIKCSENNVNKEMPQILSLLIDFELVQDLFRYDSKLLSRVFGSFLKVYEKYIRNPEHEKVWNQEVDYLTLIFNSYKEKANSTSNAKVFGKAYTEHVVQPLIELILTLRIYKIDIFNELIGLEHTLYDSYAEKDLIQRGLTGPLHVKLLLTECAIINRRNIEMFQRELLEMIFFRKKLQTEEYPIKETLQLAAYVLEVFHKHDVPFMVDGKDGVKALGNQIKSWMDLHKVDHLNEILILLSSTLNYNPLILEQHLFNITCLLIVSTKNETQQYLFEAYMKTLLEVFRKLSRAEKFVVNLLKAIREWLQSNQIEKASITKKRKSLASNDSHRANKKLKTANDAINNGVDDNELEDENQKDNEQFYLERIFNYFEKIEERNKMAGQSLKNSRKKFPYLDNTWPTDTVGKAFSTIISSLVSKPSLTIWKSLLFSLKEILEPILDEKHELSQNNLFFLDLQCAMLCQYFTGCKLVEQADKFVDQIEEERRLTKEVLTIFGKMIIEKDFKGRAAAAFFEVVYHANMLDVVIQHYIPDTTTEFSKSIQNMNDFLTEEQWSLIEEKLTIFNKNNCKLLFHRLKLQKYQAQILFTKDDNNFQMAMNEMLKKDNEEFQVENFIEDVSNKWFIKSLNKENKILLTKKIFSKAHLYNLMKEDRECIEYIILAILEKTYNLFLGLDNSVVNALLIDFNNIYEESHQCEYEMLISTYAKILASHNYSNVIENLNFDELKWCLETLQLLPIGYLRQQYKWIACMILLAIYQDIRPFTNEDILDKTYNLFIDLLRIGEHLKLVLYFNAETIVKLIPIGRCWNFYENLFIPIKTAEKGTDEFLVSLPKLFLRSYNSLSDDLWRLLLLAMKTISSASHKVIKTLRPHWNNYVQIYENFMTRFFGSFDSLDNNEAAHRRFVEKTLSGFSFHITSSLRIGKDMYYTLNPDGTKTYSEADRLDFYEKLIFLTKVYLGYSTDYRKEDSLHLMKTALTHREELQFDQPEIEIILSAYWKQIIDDIKAGVELNQKQAEQAIKLIIENKTNEDFLLTLQSLLDRIQLSETCDEYVKILKLLSLVATCPFSNIKGAIFNEKFKNITLEIALRIGRDERQLFVNMEQVQAMLHCQEAIISNRMIPVSLDSLDNVLSFLIIINIKKFSVNDSNIEDFNKLHLKMTSLATALLKYRHLQIMDRTPQFMHIFKDLLQAIVWYKSDRKKNITFTNVEVNNLSDMMMKLATLMTLIKKYSLHFKRIVPFIITFVVNLMVDNKRPTTLHSKIKTQVENICYDLISICDHRVERFILRSSNEAGRPLYEALVKDYDKYRKFKGKI